jgi:hypothetical protein
MRDEMLCLHGRRRDGHRNPRRPHGPDLARSAHPADRLARLRALLCWARAYATLRHTIEGQNGYLKDPAHEALAAPARRRVRGIAAQSLFCGVLLLAGNLRRLNAHREMVKAEGAPTSAERARRRRTSLSDFRPSG